MKRNNTLFIFLGFFFVLVVGIPLSLYLITQSTENRQHATNVDNSVITKCSAQGTVLIIFTVQNQTGQSIVVNVQGQPGNFHPGPINLTNGAHYTNDQGGAPWDTGKSSISSEEYSLLFTAQPTGLIFNPATLSVPAKSCGATPTPTPTTPVTPTLTPTVTPTSIITTTPVVTPTDTPTTPVTPTLTPGTTNTPTVTPTTGPTNTPGPTSTVNAPVCSSLVADRSTTGTPPYAITFTGSGNGTSARINKALFNFGDGPVQTVTTGGGIGTNNVSVQLSHNFANIGTFQVSVSFADTNGLISGSIGPCQLTVTTAAGPTGQIVINQTTPTRPIAQPTVKITLMPTGPKDNSVVGTGIIGVAIAIIGGLLLFGL